MRELGRARSNTVSTYDCDRHVRRLDIGMKSGDVRWNWPLIERREINYSRGSTRRGEVIWKKACNVLKFSE